MAKVDPALLAKLKTAKEVLNPDGKRSVNYFYMHDMRNHVIRAYGDSEYGDIHEIGVPSDALIGMFREVCVMTCGTGTWIVRHRDNGSLYWEDAVGTDDTSKIDASRIITDRHSMQ
jgi:hypothetical protein